MSGAGVFTLEKVLAFVKTKSPKTTYVYNSAFSCAIVQYLKASGYDAIVDEDQWWFLPEEAASGYERGGSVPFWLNDAAKKAQNFGELRNFLETLDE